MPTINKPRKPKKMYTENDKIRRSIYDTSRWRKLRASKLMNSPLCEMCLEQNKVTAGVDVHHKVSFVNAVDPLWRLELAYSYDNLQTLCKACHQKIHNS